MINEDDQETPLYKKKEYKRGETLTQKLFGGLKPKLPKTMNSVNIDRKNSNEPHEEMIAKMAD